METIIRVENLKKQYKHSKRAAVDGISFEVGKGEYSSPCEYFGIYHFSPRGLLNNPTRCSSFPKY